MLPTCQRLRKQLCFSSTGYASLDACGPPAVAVVLIADYRIRDVEAYRGVGANQPLRRIRQLPSQTDCRLPDPSAPRIEAGHFEIQLSCATRACRRRQCEQPGRDCLSPAVGALVRTLEQRSVRLVIDRMHHEGRERQHSPLAGRASAGALKYRQTEAGIERVLITARTESQDGSPL